MAHLVPPPPLRGCHVRFGLQVKTPAMITLKPVLLFPPIPTQEPESEGHVFVPRNPGEAGECIRIIQFIKRLLRAITREIRSHRPLPEGLLLQAALQRWKRARHPVMPRAS